MITKDNRTYVLSAGVVVLRNSPEGWRFLLLRAWGFWDFPKGIVEDGEEPLQAAIREVEEESTIKDLDFRWGYGFMDTGPYNKGRKIARYFVAETATAHIFLPVNPELGKPEHDAFRWCDLRETYDMVAERVRPVIKWVEEITGIGQDKGDGTVSGTS